MSELTLEVKEFIEQNIDLIEEKRWDEVYDNATFNLDSESTGKFTKAMLDIGLDPIADPGLDYIPDYYLSDTPIIEFNIPDTIHSLGEGCFSYSSLRRIIIPSSVKTLRDYVFYECAALKEITFLDDIVDIGSFVFYGCPDELVIACKENSFVDKYARSVGVEVRYL